MEGLANGIISIVIALVLFLIFRAVVLWYWKVNEIVKLLRDISQSLKDKKPSPAEKEEKQ